MQHRLYVMSIAALMILSLAGCWRKKCCSSTQEIQNTQHIQEGTCHACPAHDVDGDIDAFPAAPEDVQERVSGPAGWQNKDVLK